MPHDSVAQASCPRTYARGSHSTNYIWRGNRCEGILEYQATGAPALVSVSAVGHQDFSNTATIEVKGISGGNTNDISVKVEAFFNTERYLMNNFSLPQNGIFQWSADTVLNPRSIFPSKLRVTAKRNNQVYLPVIIGCKFTQSCPNHSISNYQFIFRSTSEISFPEVRIIGSNNEIIQSYSKLDQPSGDNITFLWNGRDTSNDLVSRGQYTFHYTYYTEERNGRANQLTGSIVFEHDPSIFR